MKIKVAWLHNYSTQINKSAGIFMYQLFERFENNIEIEIELFNIGKIFNIFVFIKNYFRYKKKLKSFDIIHAQYGSGTGYFASLFPRKNILSLRGSDWYMSPTNSLKSKIHIKLGNILTNKSLKKYDRIIVMSENMKDEIKEKHNLNNIVVIPDGIDLKKFYPVEKNNTNKFRVLFSTINNNNPIKRFNLAKESFEIFNQKYNNAELVYMQGVSHDEVNTSINSCDLILLTSTHEGWPNIIKEGLACNIPFVSTNVSDLKKIAEQTENCYICKPDKKEIASAIEKVYLKRASQSRLRQHVENFDLDIIKEKYIELYKNVLQY